MRNPVDVQERDRALDPVASFICEAPAGSGKTELLTQRVLTLLSGVPQPEAILAITFTRKAAAEMRERLSLALQSGLQAMPEEAHAQTTWRLAQSVLKRDEQLGWDLLRNPNRLQIRTFDSLCSYLNQSLPLQSALGIQIGTSEKPDGLYLQAVKEFIQSVEDDAPWSESLRVLLAHLDNHQQRLGDLFIALLKARDSWMPVLKDSASQANIREVLQGYLQQVLDDRVEKLRALFGKLTLLGCGLSDLFSLASFAASNLIREQQASDITALKDLQTTASWPGADEQDLAVWRGLRLLLTTQGGQFRSALDKRCGFPAGVGKEEKAAFKQKKDLMKTLLGQFSEQPNLLAAILDIDYWPAPKYDESQWPVLQALMETLPVLLAHLKLVFARAQEVDFIEMSDRARDALGDEESPTDLALRLDHRIEHVLVDEFQDTSFGQVELLAKLTAGWQFGDGRTLFCVGDAMQSIYGFRGAKVGLFLHCKQHGLASVPLESIQLKSNFRSQGKIVRWMNKTFVQAFPPQNDIAAGAVAYSEADDFRGDLEGDAVTFFLRDKEQDEVCEERKIQEIIQHTWGADPSASIAILIRNRGHAALAVRACQKIGLRFRSVDLIPLSDRPAVQDIMALIRGLLDPFDRVAWFSILRAPWCGLNLQDLLSLSPENGYSETRPIMEVARQALTSESLGYPLSEDGKKRLTRVLEVVGLAFADRDRHELSDWVRGTWLALGGPACITDIADQENVERVWQMLCKQTKGGRECFVDELELALDELYAAPDPQADERLQIMTIHKSKGLEFDVVILPELQRQPRAADSELFVWSERIGKNGREHWLMAPIHATGATKDATYQFIQQEKKRKEQFEACRLLYVACTRAKKKLYLLAQGRRNAQTGEWSAPPSASLLNYIWPNIKASAVALGGEFESIEGPSEILCKDRIRRLPSDWHSVNLNRCQLLEDYVLSNRFADQQVRLFEDEAQDFSAMYGTFVHEILQQVAVQGVVRWQGMDLEKLAPYWDNRLRLMGMQEECIEGAVTALTDLLPRVLHNDYLCQLLQSSKKVYAEHPLNCGQTGKKWILDLLCQVTDTQWVLVDYKTSSPRENQSQEDFLQQELKAYGPTLKDYRAIVTEVYGGSVKVYLYFVSIDFWFEVAL